MMCTHRLPQTFWPFATEAAMFMKNLMPNVNNQILYHVFYGRDPQKPFALLWTFGCLTWVNIPKTKCKKLDEPAIPAIFIRYNKEHKGWKFLAPGHNPPIFWSNSAHFLQDKLWCDCKDTAQIQDTNALHYKDMTNIEDIGYDDIDEHDEELQQPLDDIYWPLPVSDTTFEGGVVAPGSADPVVKYSADVNNTLEPNLPPASSTQASDGSTPNGSQPTTPPGLPLQLKDLNKNIRDHTFSEYLLIQKAQYYHNKFAATCEMYPWLHPTTITELLQIYLRMFPPAAEIHHFQEKLHCNGRLVDIGPLLTYDAEAYIMIATNLKPSVKEALTGPNQIHWWEAIKAEMDGLESMQVWETVDRLEGTTLVDSKLVLQVKTDADNVPYKFKARFCAHGFSQKAGIDYDEIFTPVIPKDAIRTLLTIAA
ncbi:hypothetical protein NDA11_002718 [Ustilago hordei]|uniref:Reverse transcriptase Ty1/copia-type domain-containing protein n=1 Tax=Ustilago hordei TaxID=120017 RepID=I2FZ32_USTHO|nr:uncharacterized protein UHO2_06787 [Ustilago hordei]KAJ1036875.1 hypothetical protein NDA10_001334 [Ustilago hordei]KAJ1584018.1 hypothetical protein NDA11_002718 [Ustilago hordei]KAJ1599082.1 hypothetical protein NDA14_001402 [Ustilago hordei]CCF52175.1 uncharacterized protein UHOR_08460 [Ustilago hordei]SYW83573.1 uncharacterized protein UHO2_06787 [Ustilago hordei]